MRLEMRLVAERPGAFYFGPLEVNMVSILMRGPRTNSQSFVLILSLSGFSGGSSEEVPL